jgi:ADP-ribosyl-[dinitrogen reductase] hydrolase
MRNPKQIVDKLKGGIVGFAIGDALGAPVEFLRDPVEVCDFLPSTKKGLKAGQFTDDTQHLLLSLDSIIENDGTIQLEDYSERLKRWYKSSETKSIGYTTRRAIENLFRGIDARHSGINEEKACGSLGLMRVIPPVLYSVLLPTPYKIPYSTMKKTIEITHAHKKVTRMGDLLYYFTHEMVYGKDAEEVLMQIDSENQFLNKKYRQKLRRVLELARTTESPRALEEIGTSGFVEEVLLSSIYCSMKGTSFEESVLMAVNGEGDTDSRGALTGYLCGLQYGLNEIPSRWIENLENAKELSIKAWQIYNHASLLKLSL